MLNEPNQPQVSLITPTRGREVFLPLAYACLQAQEYADFEWLILDDSPTPSRFIQSINDHRIRYEHESTPRPNGLKRNDLMKKARGKYIIQIDDDDYYSPAYVQYVVDRLSDGVDIMSMCGFFLYTRVHKLLGYWDTRQPGFAQKWGTKPVKYLLFDERNEALIKRNSYGYGFSFAFRREVQELSQFGNAPWGSDYGFIKEIVDKGGLFTSYLDTRGLALHFLHKDSVSNCFPNFVLPPFMLKSVFPELGEAWLT